MGPRIVIIGGASLQWVPKLFLDVVNTPSLVESEIVLQDINPDPLPDVADFIRHISGLAGAAITVEYTTDRRRALEGADFVVVCISTGAFDSMRHDLEIPERHGIKQSVGDTVGPGGVMRSLRNIPVMLAIARDMEEICPDAWMLNITNPMTTLCRAVTRETSVKTVGLCHEITGAQFMLSQILDVDFRSLDFEVVGVNHLPLITTLRVNGDDAMEMLREKLADPEKLADEPIFLPDEIRRELGNVADEFTKRDLVTSNRVKFALFERFGVLPGAGDRHLVEFFPGFLTEESDWGKRWNVGLTSIADREVWVDRYRAEFEKLRVVTEVPNMPSGEMVAPMIDSFLRDKTRHFPLNLPNAGQCPDLPLDAVVESMITANGDGLTGRDHAHAPAALTECLRRVVASQEMTVEAAITGDRERAVEAMLLDPLAGRIDFDHVTQMTDEMLAATFALAPAVRMSRDFTADELSVRVFDDVQSLAGAAATDAANAIRGAIGERGEANVMLATGNSQLVFLAALVQHTDVDWSRVTAFHMDEYVDLAPDHSASFQRYMREKVAAIIPVKEFHYLTGNTGDAAAEADRYAALLRSHPLDLCVCGIGENGHLAFNDPPVADFDDPADVKIVALEHASLRQQVDEGHFATIADVPTHAITVTIPALVRARRLLAIVPEARKAVPVRDALTGPITTACPASYLRRQVHATLYLDTDSASLLTR